MSIWIDQFDHFHFLSVYYPDLPLLKQEDVNKDAEAGDCNVSDKGQGQQELGSLQPAQTQNSTESPGGNVDKVGHFCYGISALFFGPIFGKPRF